MSEALGYLRKILQTTCLGQYYSLKKKHFFTRNIFSLDFHVFQLMQGSRFTNFRSILAHSNNREPYSKCSGFSGFFGKVQKWFPYLFDISCSRNVVGARNVAGRHVESTSRSQIFEKTISNTPKRVGLFSDFKNFTKMAYIFTIGFPICYCVLVRRSFW